MITKPGSGGSSLLAKKGKRYFQKLAKEGWIKRKAKLELWKKQKEMVTSGKKGKIKVKTTSR